MHGSVKGGLGFIGGVVVCLGLSGQGLAATNKWPDAHTVGATKVTFFPGAGVFTSGVTCAVNFIYGDPDAKVQFWFADAIYPNVPLTLNPGQTIYLGGVGQFQISAVVNATPPTVDVSCLGQW